jgi:hypothetical protein
MAFNGSGHHSDAEGAATQHPVGWPSPMRDVSIVSVRRVSYTRPRLQRGPTPARTEGPHLHEAGGGVQRAEPVAPPAPGAHGALEEAFDALFRSLEPVLGFGRTGRHDFLGLLGLLGLVNLRPGRCYLEGASGPLRGAALMFLGREPDGEPVNRLEAQCRALARCLGVEIQVVEETLCEWQKRRKQRMVIG